MEVINRKGHRQRPHVCAVTVSGGATIAVTWVSRYSMRILKVLSNKAF